MIALLVLTGVAYVVFLVSAIVEHYSKKTRLDAWFWTMSISGTAAVFLSVLTVLIAKISQLEGA